jgi:hypothetical protein
MPGLSLAQLQGAIFDDQAGPSCPGMPLGAETCPDGAVRFRLGVPAQKRISLVIEVRTDPVTMTVLVYGCYKLTRKKLNPNATLTDQRTFETLVGALGLEPRTR